VVDNASEDGSAGAVRERFPGARLFALEERRGKAENDSLLLREARGHFCLLLNEDSELLDGAAQALVDALEGDKGAAAAGAQLLTGGGEPTACAWRLPDAGWALAAAVFLHERYAVQSRWSGVREVGWVQSSAMLVRREAAEAVGWLDPDFFVYSDETDFCKRLHDAGWSILFVPAARAVHHDQLSTDSAAMRRRIVEFHRNRDLYFRKHDMPGTRLLWTICWTWAYLARALAAVVLPGHDPRRYLLHARQQLMPSRGAGIREAAAAYNSGRPGPAAKPVRAHPAEPGACG
jgi:N-acetylglucosaminyl-diphospho-decaprenol L-rhamnosyltransferase